MLPDVIDPPLTQKGMDQCTEQKTVASMLEGVKLIIMSPLVRCLQIAHNTFEHHLPHNTLRRVKWMAHEGVREELGMLLCNKRRPLSKTERLFPGVDFTHLPGEDDAMWENHVDKTAIDDGTAPRETTEDMSHRCYNFLGRVLALATREGDGRGRALRLVARDDECRFGHGRQQRIHRSHVRPGRVEEYGAGFCGATARSRSFSCLLRRSVIVTRHQRAYELMAMK